MKKAAGIIFIFLAYIHIAGFTPFYFYGLQEIKTEMSLELKDKTILKTIFVTAAEYHNPALFEQTDEHEFKYRGRMFDFKCMEKQGDTYVFYALQDEKETALAVLLNDIFGADKATGKNSKSPFSKLIKDFDKHSLAPEAKPIIHALPSLDLTNAAAKLQVSKGYHTPLSSPPDAALFT